MPDQRHRVLFVASHPVQYQAPIFRRLSLMPELDIRVAYCTLKGAEAAFDPEFGAKIRWDVPLLEGYPWLEVPNRGSTKESFFGLCNPGLWKLIRTGNYDAVVCYVGYVRATFWISKLAARLSNAAFLFGTDATSLVPRDGHSWKVPVKKLAWHWLLGLADHVIVPSSDTRDLALSLGLPAHSITLTPYCVENNWWVEQSRKVNRAHVRASWGIPYDDAVVLFSAKLQPWKRPLDLLRAFAKANLQEASLVFAGEGPLRPQLEAEAAALGVASRVRFLGFVNQSQLPAVYTSSDVLVLPSEYEPFGVVVNEAMCCGCVPVVSDRCGSGRDLVAPVSPGLVFPRGDVATLAKILQEVALERRRLQTLACAARARIQTWSPSENIAATVEAIKKAVAHRSSVSFDAPVAHPAPSTTQKLHE